MNPQQQGPTVIDSGLMSEVVEAEVLRDWKAAYAALQSGQFEPFSGEFVAVFDGRIVDHGQDQVTLRSRAATSLHVPPERIVVLYVDPGETTGLN